MNCCALSKLPARKSYATSSLDENYAGRLDFTNAFSLALGCRALQGANARLKPKPPTLKPVANKIWFEELLQALDINRLRQISVEARSESFQSVAWLAVSC